MSHFYYKDEEGIKPYHFVPMAKDPARTRPTRVTDVKKLKKEKGLIAVPSVTTVLNILDKPALVNWKVDKHLEQAFYTDDIDSYDDWNKVVKAKTREAMDVAPKLGTNIHKVLEDYVFTGNYPNDDIEYQIVHSVEECLAHDYSISPDSDVNKEKYILDDVYGYAGCADLIVSGKFENWVIDYKSKQTADKFKVGKMAYPEHSRQLAAYGVHCFGENNFRAANIFICLETGDIDFHEHSMESIENGWLDFKDCLSIYKRNVYNSIGE